RRKSEPASLRQLVPGVLRGLRGAASGPVARVREVWPEVVGPAVAARTRVASVEEGRIRVELASAAVRYDLATFRRAEVLKGLQERLPELRIREVSYRLGKPS
ncbi:MAG: DciA family protein, partial [Planctomycetota bacterium]